MVDSKRLQVARELCKECNWGTKNKGQMLEDLGAIEEILAPLIIEHRRWYGAACIMLGVMIGFGGMLVVFVSTSI